MESMFDKRGLSEGEAAAYVGISRSSLRQGRMNGRRGSRLPSPPFVKLGRKVIYLRDDLDSWLESNRRPLQNTEVNNGAR